MKQDQCACGRNKDVRARTCLECFKTDKSAKANKMGHRIATCRCGAPRDFRASQCNACRVKSKKRSGPISDGGTPMSYCNCGELKSIKAETCIACWKASVSRTPQEDGLLECLKCHGKFPLDQFHLRKGVPRSQCKTCHSVYGRIRNITYKCRKYGVPDSIKEMLIAATGISCEICSTWVEDFHIDHCHTTNLFRGVLCSNCNSGIGLLHDDVSRLQKAIVYLERFSEVVRDKS